VSSASGGSLAPSWAPYRTLTGKGLRERQHASTERDRRIAQEMAALVERERWPGVDDPDGSEGVAEAG
jgi:hypothetical protein